MAALEDPGTYDEEPPDTGGVVPAPAKPEPLVFTSTTPTGITIDYSPAPRRYYAVNGVEVPSVTSVLGCLEKGGLSWWGMVQGVKGVLALVERGTIAQAVDWFYEEFAKPLGMVDAAGGDVTAEDIVRFLTQEKLTVNHVLSDAGDRGTAVHDAFEEFFKSGQRPHPEIYPVAEQGYIRGLLKFMDDFDKGGVAHPKCEVTVGSVEHGYAGRFDLRCYFNGGDLVTKSYPKREDKREKVPAGKFLIDLKTSKSVYPTHAAQLIAYELASVECGYSPTDYRAVVHVTEDGRYEFVLCDAQPDDFLSILDTYRRVTRGKKEWLK